VESRIRDESRPHGGIHSGAEITGGKSCTSAESSG
jgi:hypothetical protein